MYCDVAIDRAHNGIIACCALISVPWLLTPSKVLVNLKLRDSLDLLRT